MLVHVTAGSTRYVLVSHSCQFVWLRGMSLLFCNINCNGIFKEFSSFGYELKVGSVILDERFLRAIFSKIHNLSPPFETTPPKYMNALLLSAKCSDVPEIENETCRHVSGRAPARGPRSSLRAVLIYIHIYIYIYIYIYYIYICAHIYIYMCAASPAVVTRYDGTWPAASRREVPFITARSFNSYIYIQCKVWTLYTGLRAM